MLRTYNAHFGPLWKAVQWATVQVAPFDFGVAIATVIAGLVVADVGMLLALREIFGRGRLSLLLFAFWRPRPAHRGRVGVLDASARSCFPVLASMAWTTYFHARVVRGAGLGSAVAAAVCLALGLLVSPQALFLIPFLVVWTWAFPQLTRVGTSACGAPPRALPVAALRGRGRGVPRCSTARPRPRGRPAG